MENAVLTRQLLFISDSRCHRRVGRNHGCSIQVVKTGVGHLTLLEGLRRIRDLRQTGVMAPSVFLFFAILKFTG